MNRTSPTARAKFLEALLKSPPWTSSWRLREMLPELVWPVDCVPYMGKFVVSVHPEANRVWVTFKEPPKPNAWREPSRRIEDDDYWGPL